MGNRIIFSIALRNIIKHPGKNTLLGVMVFLSTLIFLFTASLVSHSKICWRDYFSETTTGYINAGVLMGTGKDMKSPEFDFPERFIPEEMITYLDTNNISYSKRIRASGIKYNFEKQKFDGEDDTSNIIGSDFENELRNLTNLEIVEGKYDPDVYNGAVAWKKLMTRYNLKIGDEISFFIDDPSGMPMPYTFVITGACTNISGNNLEVEDNHITNPIIFVKYDFLTEKLGLENGQYTEVSIWNRSNDVIESVKAPRSRATRNQKLNISHLPQQSNGECPTINCGDDPKEIKALAEKNNLEFYYADEANELIGAINDFVSFLGRFVAFLIMGIFIVAAFNINIMGFIDRQKEIGTMLALGSKPAWIIRLLFSEMLIFSLAAFVISVLICSTFGLIFPEGVSFGELGILFSDRNYIFRVLPYGLIISFLSVCGAMFLSAVYPAYLTFKMDPVEVFREGNL